MNTPNELPTPAIVAPTLPELVRGYNAYEPPFDVAAAATRMLESVPPKYLVGLDRIVLTNATSLPRRRRRGMTKSRGRKVSIASALGLYHPAYNNSPAWIEIFVDNCLRGWERGFWLKIPFIREERLSSVLFHEIGHHIHFTLRPEYREKEDVADVWKVRLDRIYMKQRWSWLRIILIPIRFIFAPLISAGRKRLAKVMMKRGWISRAEFEEEVRGI